MVARRVLVVIGCLVLVACWIALWAHITADPTTTSGAAPFVTSILALTA